MKNSVKNVECNIHHFGGDSGRHKLTENNWLGNETFVINKCESKTIEKVSFIQQAIDFLLGR